MGIRYKCDVCGADGEYQGAYTPGVNGMVTLCPGCAPSAWSIGGWVVSRDSQPYREAQAAFSVRSKSAPANPGPAAADARYGVWLARVPGRFRGAWVQFQSLNLDVNRRDVSALCSGTREEAEEGARRLRSANAENEYEVREYPGGSAAPTARPPVAPTTSAKRFGVWVSAAPGMHIGFHGAWVRFQPFDPAVELRDASALWSGTREEAEKAVRRLSAASTASTFEVKEYPGATPAGQVIEWVEWVDGEMKWVDGSTTARASPPPAFDVLALARAEFDRRLWPEAVRIAECHDASTIRAVLAIMWAGKGGDCGTEKRPAPKQVEREAVMAWARELVEIAGRR